VLAIRFLLVHNSFIDKTARDEMSELDKATAHYQEQYKLVLFHQLEDVLRKLVDASNKGFKSKLAMALSDAIIVLAKVEKTK
jgi:hypothetical protein